MSIQRPAISAMHDPQYGADVMNDMPSIEGHSSRIATIGGWTAYCAAVLTTKGEPNSIRNPAANPAPEPKQEGHDASRRV